MSDLAEQSQGKIPDVVASSYAEDDLFQLSGLQHLLFCERQCALIHIEQLWAENRLTAEGRILHDRADSGESEWRGEVRVEFGMPIRSLMLGLSGRADVVEFQRPAEPRAPWQPLPVEYKRGKPKPDHSDLVQLCAQAMCLEEMMGVEVPAGAMFYGKPRRRLEVVFDATLRDETTRAAARLHELIRGGKTPVARYEKKCESCSLMSICMPKVTGSTKSVGKYLANACRG